MLITSAVTAIAWATYDPEVYEPECPIDETVRYELSDVLSEGRVYWIPNLFCDGTTALFSAEGTLVVNADGTGYFDGIATLNSGDCGKGLIGTEWVAHWEMDPKAGNTVPKIERTSPDSANWQLGLLANGSLTYGAWEVTYDNYPNDNSHGNQVGFGANNKNDNFGGASWFDWKLWEGGCEIRSGAHGDVNYELDCIECVVDGTGGDLGPAEPFNVFVFGDYTGGLDVEGAIVACDDLEATGFNFGYGLGGGNAVLVGDDATLTSGTVGGNLVHGGTASLTWVTFNNSGSAINAAVDCAADQADLETRSLDFAGLAANGTVTDSYGALTLTGTSNTLNVFAVTEAEIELAHTLNINVPAGSTVLINVSGASLNFGNFGQNLVGATAANILFNFFEATDITVSGVGLKGSVLAPLADVTFANGNMTGTLVAYSLTGGVEMYEATFEGGIDECPVEEGDVGEDDGVENPLPEFTCDATVTANTWWGGYQTDVSVSYSGAALSDWQVVLGFGSAPTINTLWNGSYSAVANTLVVDDAGWNASNNPFSFGYVGSGTYAEPTVTLNGVLCN